MPLNSLNVGGSVTFLVRFAQARGQIRTTNQQRTTKEAAVIKSQQQRKYVPHNALGCVVTGRKVVAG